MLTRIHARRETACSIEHEILDYLLATEFHGTATTTTLVVAYARWRGTGWWQSFRELHDAARCPRCGVHGYALAPGRGFLWTVYPEALPGVVAALAKVPA